MTTPVYGVTPTGFVLKPVQQILKETIADLLGLIDPTTDVSPDQPLGQALGILAKKNGELWQLAETAYNATNRGAAEADLLDNIGSLTGTIRQGETHSTVQCTATFSAAGTYPAGSLVAYPAPPAANTSQFANANLITVPNVGGDGVNAPSVTNTWPSLSGSAGILTFAGGNVTLTGTGSTSIPGSLVTQFITITDADTPANNGTFEVASTTANSITWANPGGATDAHNGAITWSANPVTTFLFQSIDFGPLSGDALIGANAAGGGAGHLTQKTPVAGWASVADVGEVTVGTLEEEDAPYRVRQYQDLAAAGNDTIDATAAAILTALQNAPVPPVGASVRMYENTTLTAQAGPPTGNGLPPKSYMAVVYDGPNGGNPAQNDSLIGQAIWNNHPAGIQIFAGGGTVTTIAVPDKQGVLRTVTFARPTLQEVVFSASVSVGPTIYNDPVAKAQLQATIAVALVNASQGKPFTLYGATVVPAADAPTTLAPGVDVVRAAFQSIVQGQAGVKDVQSFFFTSPAPDGATGNVVIDLYHQAALDILGSTINIVLFTV